MLKNNERKAMDTQKEKYKLKRLHEFLKGWYREFSNEWTHIDDVPTFDLFETVGYKGLWWYIINKTNYLDNKEINAGKFFKISHSGLCFIREEDK